MKHIAGAIVALALAAPAAAASRDEVCGYMADVAGALQQARLAGVPEERAGAHVLEAGPDWPDNYDRAIAPMTPWVYSQDMGQLSQADLPALWRQTCGANWEQFAAMFED